jgi:hypothetical protein
MQQCYVLYIHLRMFVQDPHLKRSFKLIMFYSGLASFCACFLPPTYAAYYSPLKATDVEKNVMFQEETLLSNADLPKDKRSVYRNRKLSKADRMHLYQERPDLDLRSALADPSASPPPTGDAPATPPKSAMKGSRAAAAAPSENGSSPSGSGSPGRGRRARSPAGAAQETEVSREEEAAALFHAHVAAGTLTIGASAGSLSNGADPAYEVRVRSASRTRSSSFHSGSGDGKSDLRAPLLGEEHKHLPSNAGASSYPQQSSSLEGRNNGFSISNFLLTRSGSKAGKTSPTGPLPMDVVSAGFRSSSTERLLLPNNGLGGAVALEEGLVSASPTGRELVQLHVHERESEVRRKLDSGDVSTLTNENEHVSGDISSSDDDSDEEDKELSTPIHAL